MKARDSIIWLALLSLFLVLGDGVHHVGKVLMARVTLRNIKADDENWENVHDAIRDQCWLVGKDLVIMAAQGGVMFLAMKRKPNPHGGANRRQPLEPDSNPEPAAAASRRSP